jgi:hypothetical protein
MTELAWASEILNHVGGIRAIRRKKRNAVWKGAYKQAGGSYQFVHFPKWELLINIA